MPTQHLSVQVDMPPGGFISNNASVSESIRVWLSTEQNLIIAEIGRCMMAMTPDQWRLLIDAVEEVRTYEVLA